MQRLAATELGGVGVDDHRVAAELVDADLERHPRARGGLFEDAQPRCVRKAAASASPDRYGGWLSAHQRDRAPRPARPGKGRCRRGNDGRSCGGRLSGELGNAGEQIGDAERLAEHVITSQPVLEGRDGLQPPGEHQHRDVSEHRVVCSSLPAPAARRDPASPGPAGPRRDGRRAASCSPPIPSLAVTTR